PHAAGPDAPAIRCTASGVVTRLAQLANPCIALASWPAERHRRGSQETLTSTVQDRSDTGIELRRHAPQWHFVLQLEQGDPPRGEDARPAAGHHGSGRPAPVVIRLCRLPLM